MQNSYIIQFENSYVISERAAKANTLYRIILRGSTKQHDDVVRWDGPRSAGPKNALS
jgi:hypothetical protein